ncbi:MAG: sulfatase [Planctomycetes bacterium]|nr:sulfatase [Planctomycetota bacterium]
MCWRVVIASICVGLLAGCAEEPRPPNLLVILLDTTRADHLSSYGYERATTPTIDALADRGARFSEIYSQSSLTPVSASTLLSGAHPYRHGVRSLFVVGRQSMASDVASLPELLTRSGRRTVGFVSAKPMGAQYGLARGFESYHDDLSATLERYHVDKPSDAAQRPADDTTELVLEWLEQRPREPFALFVHYFDAHDPSFVPPRAWLEQHVSFPLPPKLARSGPEQRIPALGTPSNRVELYDAELRFMDEQIARVLARLEAQGELDNTLIVVTADHGEAFGEHDFWTHGILYQEQLHVPLIMAGPGVPRGRVVDGRGRLVDLLPTLAELLDLPAPRERLDGSSLAPLLRGAREDAPREVYSEVRHAAEDRLARDPEMYALRVKDWKYIHRPSTGRHELYDLARDPEELEDRSSEHPELTGALRYRLGQLGALGGALPSLEGLSAEQIAELKRLGYL